MTPGSRIDGGATAPLSRAGHCAEMAARPRMEPARWADARRATALEEWPADFFAQAADMFCVAGTDGYFKALNPAWTRVLGWTQEELLARPYIDFVHPDDRQATVTEAAKIATGFPSLH